MNSTPIGNKVDGLCPVTMGLPQNPLLSFIEKGTSGRMAVILSGHCPDCDETLVGHHCNNHPELPLFH